MSDLMKRDAGVIVEKIVTQGDVSALSPAERAEYYNRVCDALGLNPLTQPFEFIKLNGKLRMYAKREAAEQLRKINGISVDDMQTQVVEGVYVVRVKGHDASGRTDMATGAVPVDGLKGEALANAMLKAETKAKRRLTLSISGLGMLDETEVDSIPSADRNVTPPQSDGELQEARGVCLRMVDKAREDELIGDERRQELIDQINASKSVDILRSRYKKMHDEFDAAVKAREERQDLEVF